MITDIRSWVTFLLLFIVIAACCRVPYAPHRKQTDIQCAAATKIEECGACHDTAEKPISRLENHSLTYEPCLKCHPVEPRR